MTFNALYMLGHVVFSDTAVAVYFSLGNLVVNMPVTLNA